MGGHPDRRDGDGDGDGDGERISFLGRRLPPSFALRLIAVAPGGERAYDEAEWRDAIVVVERGEVELALCDGGSRRFRRGDLLWLEGLPLRALRNPGGEPAVLVAVSRRCPPPAAQPGAGPGARP